MLNTRTPKWRGPMSTTASSSATAPPTLPCHSTSGGMPQPIFYPRRAACPSCARRNRSWHHAVVVFCSVKQEFIAAATAKRFGHEKYINVTTSFITAFIPHLMFSLCDLHTKYIFKGKHIHFYFKKREDTKQRFTLLRNTVKSTSIKALSQHASFVHNQKPQSL